MNDGLALYTQLRHHTGGGTVYHHALVASFLYTSGVRDFAMNAGGGAYWLLDILATEPEVRKLVEQGGFALVLLKVAADTTAVLTVAGDTNAPPVLERKLDFTDCPVAPTTPGNAEGAWKFYLEVTGTLNKRGDPQIMCMLPMER